MLPDPQKSLFDELLALTATELDDENDKIRLRDAYIKDVFRNGGKGFVERIRKYGYTDKGDRILIDDWFAEYAEFIADFRIPYTITSGCCQVGKSALHNLLVADIVIHGKLNIGFFYGSRDSRELNVHEQIKPVLEKYAEEYEKDKEITIRQRSDRKLSSRYQIDGITAIFSYLSTSTGSPSQAKAGLASAGGSAVSFTANVCFVEEASQSTQEAKSVVEPRLAASKIPTKPRRDLGTPGAGAGVEQDIADATHEFYVHAQCPSCRKVFPLHPLGCLLKSIKRRNAAGKEVDSFFTDSGKPLLWWCHDSDNPITTAYIGCPHCSKELPNEARHKARYKCIRTGVWLRDFLDGLPVDDPETCSNLRHKAAIHMSPLIRNVRYNLAADIINKGLSASNPSDWQQQILGIASSTAISNITLDMLKKAIAAPKPDGSYDFVLAGIDRGNSHDFLTIAQIYLPENHLYLEQQEISKQSVRRVVFSSNVEREKIPQLLKQHKVDFGICDNEPGRDKAMELCDETGVLQMADQKDKLKDAVKKDKVLDGGAEYPCWFVRNQKFQDLVLENFIEMHEDGYPLYRLPEVWNKFIGSKSDLSPIRHMMAPTRDAESDRWLRPADGNDDIFYSFLFLEVAFYIKCLELGKYPEWINGV